MWLLAPEVCAGFQAAGLRMSDQTGSGVAGVERTEMPELWPLESRRLRWPGQEALLLAIVWNTVAIGRGSR